MCVRAQEIAGITVGTIMKRRGAPFTAEQEILHGQVEWGESMKTFLEPEDLTGFLDSLDTRQLGQWGESMKECEQSVHFTKKHRKAPSFRAGRMSKKSVHRKIV